MAKPLTARSVEQAKPGSKVRELPDGALPSLYLVVQPSGTRSFALRYRHVGRARNMTLGRWPAFSLGEAREAARAALRVIAEGRDPAAERRQAKHDVSRSCGRNERRINRNGLISNSDAGGSSDADTVERGGMGTGAAGLPGLSLAPRRQGAGRPQVSGSGALFLGAQHHLAGAAGGVRQLEQRLEALLAAEPGRGVRSHDGHARRHERDRPHRPNVRFHGGPRPCLGRRRQRGQDGQALGRSRGGFSTKLHLKTDFDGHVLAFDLTGGEKADAPHFETLLGLGPDIDPRAALGDKGYDSKANRLACRKRGIAPAIPFKSNARDKPSFFPKALYKGRARIEQSVGKLKRFKRIALRCEKTKTNFLSFVARAAAFTLIKSVHTT